MDQVRQRAERAAGKAGGLIDKLLPAMSIFTMVMTVPQVWSVWIEQKTEGVSLLSWGAYTIAACLWFMHGLQRRDRAIWLACVGWVILDGAVVVGLLVRR
jgi:uncharacterized protein with PQ loop repeat